MGVNDIRDMKTTRLLLGDLETNQGSDMSSRDIMLNKVVEEIYSTKNLDVKTELSDKEIILFSRADIYTKISGVDILDKFVTAIKRKKISKKRASRKELVDIVKSTIDPVEPELNSIGKRFRGF